MKKIIFFSIILIFLSCVVRKNFNNSSEIYSPLVLDTILEKNNPKNLDFSKPQLFIDTTKNSKYYTRFINWKPKKSINKYIIDLSEKFNSKTAIPNEIPEVWISLEKLNDDFVIYSPCDGNTFGLQLINNSIVLLERHETSYNLVYQVDNNNELILKLKTGISESQEAKISIKKTRKEHIYLLNYSNKIYSFKKYITPQKNIREFNIIVNHCPTDKLPEYDFETNTKNE